MTYGVINQGIILGQAQKKVARLHGLFDPNPIPSDNFVPNDNTFEFVLMVQQ